jgi:para-aminobenzoate synthetase component 1
MQTRSPQGQEQILVEDGPGGRPALFRAAQAVLVAQTGAEVPALLAELDKARAKGFWVAGYLSYEAGYALEPKLVAQEPDGGGPRAVFGVFAGPEDAAALLDTAAAEARGVQIAPVEPMISRAAYDAAMARVMGYIGSGDCYQINLTFPMQTRLLQGSALGLYGALRTRQAVGRGAYVDLGTGPVLVLLNFL